MTLRLEYICTEAESKEAQNLIVQRQCGGGPKWRSVLVYWVFIAVMVGLLFLRFKMEVAPRNRIWFVGMVIVVFFAVQFYKRATRRKRDQPVRTEVSEQELIFNGCNGRTAIPWSAFGQCLESPAVFVLVDKPKRILFAIPKRAFPDEKSRDWFRALGKQLENSGASMLPPGETLMPGRFTGKGVALTVQLGFRDYLVRMATSWRSKGMAFGIVALSMGYCLFGPEPENAVNSRGKTLVIMALMMIPIFAVVFLLVILSSWRSEKKFLEPQHLAVSGDGIQFAGNDGSGLLAWSTYKYYLENRWAFFVWNPDGSLWMMLPKRQFASPMDIAQCRDLLQTNLKASRWFIF